MGSTHIVQQLLLSLFPSILMFDFDLLNLALPTSSKEKEVVWVIGIYVNYAWQTLVARDDVLKVEKFFVFLTYKYRKNESFLGRIE